jgi:tetratricopeptide (TPR) repeat protein
MKRLLLLAAALGAGVGAYWSARLAYGEILYGRGTAESVGRAAKLAPGDAQYGRRGAELAEAAGLNAEKAAQALEAVLRAEPGNAETLIKLGLRAEMRNDFAAAERDLLEAARYDRGYDPRWSLANYYFRRQEGENFWRWARAAGEMAYEPAPLFRLLWNYTDDAEKILDRAIPKRPEILRQYLGFLTGGPHWESADSVAKRILERPGTEDVPFLMAYCDRLLDARRGRAALELWNTLGRRKLSGFGELDPARGPVNGGFATSPTNRGFDWRLAAVEGVTASQDTPGVRLSFSGQEPEACDPLWQFLMLEAGARYRMTFEYATSGVAERSGLRWRVEDLSGTPAVIAESDDLAHEGWSDGSVEFTTPAGMLVGRVVLSYRRAPGTTRTEGVIHLRSIALGRVN